MPNARAACQASVFFSHVLISRLDFAEFCTPTFCTPKRREFRQLVSGKVEQALDQDELQKFADNQCDPQPEAYADQRWFEL
ncbi:hypothetical protein [Bradyrhizobium jicamae]|uniref:hypothetical protein n=1 Tax=Bradyrhizobium jicamae TaxID=280332 RepID=UPI00071114EE|nr:hypothetical protein [Bradyrhizobium jicamae]